ncbi:hypothetical protein [Lysobacter gummosus]|uniref:hypothetical protein n=1 Tax=Lysobacter gummosus TaxID=262324 RepID=UPI00362B3D71
MFSRDGARLRPSCRRHGFSATHSQALCPLGPDRPRSSSADVRLAERCGAVSTRGWRPLRSGLFAAAHWRRRPSHVLSRKFACRVFPFVSPSH